MACIDDIVTLGACPDEGVSKSGLTLLMAPGMSQKIFANIANETYIQGREMVMAKKKLALITIKNDFVGVLQANRVITTISNPIYDTSVYNLNASVGTSDLSRGVTIHKNTSYRGKLRKTIIKSVQCYPRSSGTGVLEIKDGFNTYAYEIDLVGGQVNTFDHDILGDFPFYINSDCHSFKVLIRTDVDMASAFIQCKKGCNNPAPNPCGWADGWGGTKAVQEQGYGVNVQFYCECDYTQILCDLSSSYSGELIWLKWQILVMEEQCRTDRFNNWVIYNRDEIWERILPDLNNKYTEKWNNLMSGLLGILNTYRDECLNCRGLRRVVNI